MHSECFASLTRGTPDLLKPMPTFAICGAGISCLILHLYGGLGTLMAHASYAGNSWHMNQVLRWSSQPTIIQL